VEVLIFYPPHSTVLFTRINSLSDINVDLVHKLYTVLSSRNCLSEVSIFFLFVLSVLVSGLLSPGENSLAIGSKSVSK
jgi:hypothetical protein